MTGLIWSILLAAIGITGIYFAGRKNLWGWAISLGAQLLWIIFAIVTGQYGFILSAVAYGAVYGKNFVAWYREERPAHGRRRQDVEHYGIELFATGEERPATVAETREASATSPRHWNGKIVD